MDTKTGKNKINQLSDTSHKFCYCRFFTESAADLDVHTGRKKGVLVHHVVFTLKSGTQHVARDFENHPIRFQGLGTKCYWWTCCIINLNCIQTHKLTNGWTQLEQTEKGGWGKTERRIGWQGARSTSSRQLPGFCQCRYGAGVDEVSLASRGASSATWSFPQWGIVNASGLSALKPKRNFLKAKRFLTLEYR